MTRRVVLHQDDVGMCHGANVAFVELSALGGVSSGSVMVPCPWFSEIAELAAADPSLDLGVHLTLTSEKAHYRWGPISGPPAAAHLTDDRGYLWRDVASVRRHVDPEAVEVELRAQVDRALGAGIDVTHLDAHMGAVIAPELCDVYVRLGVDYGVPVLLTTTLAGYGPSNHLAGVGEEQYAPFVEEARRAGMPTFDAVRETPWERAAEEPIAPTYRQLFSGTPEGMTFFALHPNAPGELEAIEPATAHVRTDEYDFLRTGEHLTWLADDHVEVIGMRQLRDTFRA